MKHPRVNRRSTAPGRVAIGLLLSSLLLPRLSPGQEPQSPEAPPGLEVRAQASPATATVGDPIEIDIELTLPPGYEVQLPDLNSRLGEFTVLEPLRAAPGPDPATAGGSPGESRPVYRARVDVAVYRTGEFEFPSITLLLRDPSGKEIPVPTPAVAVTIASVLAEGDTEPMPLKKQADIPEPFPLLSTLLLALLVLLLAAAGWWLWVRRQKPAAAGPGRALLDPLDLAEAELRDLLGRALLEKGLVKPFYVSLSEIVKGILEEGYRITASERTTAEILESLEARLAQEDAREERARIADFLLSCDLVKFAKFVPSRPDSDAAVKRAFEILDCCRRRRSALSTPETSRAEEVA